MSSVYLIGYRGTGKSTVAIRLAERLARPWIDSDALIEGRTGMSIREIFDAWGEAAFRDLEASVVQDVTAQRHVVAALGGGAVLREASRHAVRDAGWVVWLQAAPQTIRQRIANDPLSAGRRPNLTALEETEEISTLLQQRRPIYQQCADLAVETDGKTADEIADLIIELLHQGGFPSEPVRDDAD